MAWATSNQVGCGATQCNPVEEGGEGVLLVCNYGPSWVTCLWWLLSLCLFNSRNLEGQSPYMTGDEGQSPYMTGDSSCSNCPDNKKSCVNNLCSNGEVITYCYMLRVNCVLKPSHHCTQFCVTSYGQLYSGLHWQRWWTHVHLEFGGD